MVWHCLFVCFFNQKSIREIQYWPSVIMILADRIHDHCNFDKLIYVYDNRVIG